MKIIQIMPEFGLAGAEIMAENLSYGLSNKGNDVILVSFYSKETEITKRLVQHGFEIVYLDKRQGFDKTIITKLRKLFVKEKPEVIHTHRYVLPYVFIAAYGIPLRIVHTVHNVATKEVGYTIEAADDVMATGFNWCPPLAMYQLLSAICDVPELIRERLPDICQKMDIEEYLADIEPSKYDYRPFLKAVR